MKASGWAGWLCILCVTAIGVTFAQAQLSATSPPSSAPPAAPTYKSLLDQGYEVKSVVVLSAGMSTRAAQAIEQDSVLITLQKGAATATCWITLTGWSAHNVSTVPCSPMT